MFRTPYRGSPAAAAVAVDLLLHPAANLIDRPPGQGHDVESIQDSGGVGELVVAAIRFPTPDEPLGTVSWFGNNRS